MRRVIIESPYAGDTVRNITYLRACLHDSLLRGEAPFASHALYTQRGVLNDEDPSERLWGIAAGLEWAGAAEATIVYADLGISPGMVMGMKHADKCGRKIETRYLGAPWSNEKA